MRMLGAAKNGAIFGGIRRRQRRHGGGAAGVETMGEDAVQNSTASFYIFSLLSKTGENLSTRVANGALRARNWNSEFEVCRCELAPPVQEP